MSTANTGIPDPGEQLEALPTLLIMVNIVFFDGQLALPFCVSGGQFAMSDNAIMNTYNRLDLTFDRGEGCYLIDENEDRYLDAVGGLAVNILGHAHPAVTDAITAQAGKLLHTSNLYQVKHQQTLAARLTTLTGMSNCFFSNSGAEANEAAIKIARLYGHKQGIAKPGIIVTEGAFHGRTMATLSATGNRKIQAGFEPLVSGFVRAPFNNLEALQHIGRNNPDIVAILVEPIQGEGGVNTCDHGYLRGIRELCDSRGWLMMLDEIQTGMGRTGSFAHYQAHDILPDVVTLAKGLANGVPIGTCLVSGAADGIMQPGNHGSTFGGNPLACATALAVLDVLEQENIMRNARERGEQIVAGLSSALESCDLVRDIRGRGLMAAVELSVDCGHLVADAISKGVLINVTAGSVIRLLPPLILSEQEADTLIATVSELVLGLARDSKAA